MRAVDEITVTNKFMQGYYREKTGNQNITVIPNYPPKWWMGNFYDKDKVMRNYTKTRKKPRVVYCASGAHFDVENRENSITNSLKNQYENLHRIVYFSINLYKDSYSKIKSLYEGNIDAKVKIIDPVRGNDILCTGRVTQDLS